MMTCKTSLSVFVSVTAKKMFSNNTEAERSLYTGTMTAVQLVLFEMDSAIHDTMMTGNMILNDKIMRTDLFSHCKLFNSLASQVTKETAAGCRGGPGPRRLWRQRPA